MKRTTYTVAFSAMLALLSGCGGGATPKAKEPQSGAAVAAPDKVNKVAESGFKAALDKMVALDKSNGWNEGSCNDVAKMFLDAADSQKKAGTQLPQAVYNAGLAYQRCHKDAEAKTQFQNALSIDAQFHRARVQIALYSLKEGGDGALQGSIQELTQAVQDAKFQNVEALVNLAALQMRRRDQSPDQDGANDYERAKKNLQRALAIDDGYQPAFNQLALYYFEMAKMKVGRAARRKTATFAKTGKTDQQMLELAALVCSQAIRKNASYAAIHNTAGLIQVELQNINSAVQEFQAAAQLDPTFFEAQMNYAAVNLSFRGFEAAEKAYRAALKIRPNDYDAHLGLALALRGQINDSNFDQKVKDAQGELDQCKKIAPDRAETYYNEGILTQEFKAKGVGQNAIPVLKEAVHIYDTFVQKADPNEFKDAIARAKDRSQDLADIIRFIEEGQNAAAIEAARQEKEASKPTEDETAPAGDSAAPSDSSAPAPAPAPAQ